MNTDTAPSATDSTEPAVEPVEPQQPADKPNPLLDELKQERRQRKALESRLADLERAAEEARQAALPEQERLVEQARKEAREATLAEVRAQVARAQVHAAAAALGFVDPGDAAAHLDMAALDPDKDGTVDAAVRALAEAKPYLLGRPAAAPKVPGGPQSSTPAKPTFNEFLQGAIRSRQG